MRRMILRSLVAAVLMVPAVLVPAVTQAGSAECQAKTFDGFSATDDERIQRNGTAAYTEDGRLRLTPEQPHRAGSAFTIDPITLAGDASFSTTFSFEFTTSNEGADGLVFVVQTQSNDVGSSGEGIGYQGIGDSAGVEFDNYFNDLYDPNASHVGIDVNGDVDSVATATVSPDLDNGGVFYTWVDYDGATDTFEVRLSQVDLRPEDPILAEVLDLPAILGSTDAFLGFTSATGAFSANHDVLAWTLTSCFAPLGVSEPPSVDAGGHVSGDEGAPIPLDGTVTDPDPEETVTTLWSVEEGAPCTFADAAAVDTTVTCTKPGTYTLRLTADDGVNEPVSDTVTVTVTFVEEAPEPVFKPIGYRLVAADGGVFTFGQRAFHGSLGDRPLDRAIVGGADDPTSFEGYWLVASDGSVFAFGTADLHGSLASEMLDAPVVEIEPTPTGKGYWLVSADGKVFPFGDAKHEGDMATRALNQPVIGMSATFTGRGYWLVAEDGGIFSFGDAKFHGSMGATPLNAPIDDLAPIGDDSGYYLVARDGGVFSFGNAPFHGSTGAMTLNDPVIAMLPHPDGRGYWLGAKDGGVFTFGALPFFGSMGNVPLTSPVNDFIH